MCVANVHTTDSQFAAAHTLRLVYITTLLSGPPPAPEEGATGYRQMGEIEQWDVVCEV